MAYKIAFFGAKPYDIASFDKINERMLLKATATSSISSE